MDPAAHPRVVTPMYIPVPLCDDELTDIIRALEAVRDGIHEINDEYRRLDSIRSKLCGPQGFIRYMENL